MTDSRPPASTDAAQTPSAGVPGPAEPAQAISGPRTAAAAWRIAAMMVQDSLDALRAHGGRSTPVFELLIFTLDAMAEAAESEDSPDDRGRARAREDLAAWSAQWAGPPTIGHELAAHRDLGFCAACVRGRWTDGTSDGYGQAQELTGWRLLALAERGVPDQPARNPERRT